MVAASNQLMIVSLAHKWWFLKVGDSLQFDVGVPAGFQYEVMVVHDDWMTSWGILGVPNDLGKLQINSDSSLLAINYD